MRLFSPGALWFLSLIPLLVLMYILKQRYQEHRVSSLYLWQQVMMDLDATSPFQRLKNNILFFLQLLALLLCIFALANPFLWWKNNNYENLVLVIDASGSMSALGEKGTKLEEAKIKAEELIDSLSFDSKVTLISAARNVKVEMSGSSDRKSVVKKLREIEPTNSAGNIDDAYSLVKAICSQLESYKVIYFTDSDISLEGLNGEVVLSGPERSNVSLDYIAQSKTEDGLKVMVRATNHGTEKADAEICLYADDRLVDIKEQAMAPGETKTVYFDGVPLSAQYIYGELSKEDGLLEDNRVYSVVKQADAKKVLLSTEQNIFLEKALNTLKDIEVYKTLPGEKINDEFDLYIYDGSDGRELSQSGNLLFINPQEDSAYFKVGQAVQGGKAGTETHAITKYMEGSSFVISKLKELELPYWAAPVLKEGEAVAAFAGEIKGQKIAVVGFDLHDTDFPLLPEFPIFINNLVSYLIDRDTMMADRYNCGDSIDINALPEAEKLFVTSPDSRTEELGSAYPIRPFENTQLPGIYQMVQKVGGEDVTKLLAVNFPISESAGGTGSSNLTGDDDGLGSGGTGGVPGRSNAETGSKSGLNLMNPLLLLALLIICIEWMVYARKFA